MELYIGVAVACLIVLAVVLFTKHKKSSKLKTSDTSVKETPETSSLEEVSSVPSNDNQVMKEAREMVQSMNNSSSETKTQVSNTETAPQQEVESVEDIREKKKIQRDLIETNFYCKSNVSLETCSKKLGISTRQLSARIKKYYNKSFLQFINDLRMEKVITLIKDENITKVNDLMYMTGYKNRTTFNNLFKKKMNMTVTEFRESLKHEDEHSI